MKLLLKIFRHALEDEDNRLLMASSPVVFLHLGCIGLFFTGFSWVALAVMFLTFSVRVFALTAGFHRYFSHRSFKTSRVFQFVLVWWAPHPLSLGQCGGPLIIGIITSTPMKRKIFIHR